MSEKAIKEAFLLGAGDLNPPEDLWQKVEREIGLRESARWPWQRRAGVASAGRGLWQRVAVAAAALLLIGGLTLGFSPTARAVLDEALDQLKTVWSGQVAGEMMVVQHGTDEDLQAFREQGKMPMLPFETVSGLEEAAQRTGMTPPVLNREGAVLTQVRVSLFKVPEGEDAEHRRIHLFYNIDGKDVYEVGRQALFDKGEFHPSWVGSWIYFGPGEMESRVVKSGAVEALCVESKSGLASGAASCHWTENGYPMFVSGPDAKVVESLIADVAR